jgi:hypothetical protein
MNPPLNWIRIPTLVFSMACLLPGGLRAELQLLDASQPYGGRTHAEWAEAWSRWLASIPVGPRHPQTERTGVAQAEGQSGPVWFLAGPPSQAGAPARHILVPEGRIVMVPIDGVSALNRIPMDPQGEAYIRGLYTNRLNNAVQCRLDGVTRTDLSAYEVATPLYHDVTIAGTGTPPEVAGPGMTWGTFLPIAPPVPGRHALTLTSTSPGQPTRSVTYEIDVVPGLPGISALPSAQNGGMAVRWPATAGGFVLQESAPLLSGPWTPVAATLETNAVGIRATLPTPGANGFVRLHRAAQAGLVAHEWFATDLPGNYASLTLNSGGVGFTGPWRQGGFNVSGSANFAVDATSLVAGGAGPSGGRVRASTVGAISGVQRTLAQPLRAVAGSREVFYLSFRIRPDGVLGAGAFNGFLGLTFNDELFVGKPGGGALNEWVIEQRGGTNPVNSGRRVASGQTDLLVLKLDFRLPRRVFLWVNPAADDVEPARADAVHTALPATISALGLYSTGAFSFDDLRVGEAYADVVP